MVGNVWWCPWEVPVPLDLLCRRFLPICSTLGLVPGHPLFSIVLSTIYWIVVNRNGLFDPNLYIQPAVSRLSICLRGTVGLVSHDMRAIARSRVLMSDENLPMSTLFSSVCKGWDETKSSQLIALDVPRMWMRIC